MCLTKIMLLLVVYSNTLFALESMQQPQFETIADLAEAVPSK